MNSSGVSYEATPLEQAYALYLVHQVFGIGLPLPNHNTAINLSGRSAVGFLTQSGVDRQILRSVWSVADPQNFGSLTSLRQLHVVLRLVAMAQAGILPDGSVNGLTAALQRCAGQPLNLPVFQNVIMMQPNQYMAMYGHLVVRPQQQQQPNVQQQQNQQQQFQPQPQQPQNTGGFLSAAAPAITPPVSTPAPAPAPPALQSVGDAFGSLVEVEDKPLAPLEAMGTPVSSQPPDDVLAGALAAGSSTPNPSLEMPSAPPNAAAAFTTPTPARPAAAAAPGGTGGFGFWSLGSPSVADRAREISATATPIQTRPPVVAAPAVSEDEEDDDDDDDFGDFGSATPAEVASAPAPSTMEPGSNDDFGDFGSALSTQPSTTVEQGSTDDFGDFGSAAPAPSTMEQGSNDADDDFGDFGSAAPTQSSSAMQPGTADDFGAFGSAPTSQSSTLGSADDFGGFGSAPAAAPPTLASTHNNLNNPTIGGFSMNPVPAPQPFVTDSGRSHSEPIGGLGGAAGNAAHHTKSLSTVSDAFGDLGPIADAPLPSLEAFGSTTTSSAPALEPSEAATTTTNPAPVMVEEASDEEDDDDGFGDFADAAATPADTTPSIDMFGMGEATIAPTQASDSTFLAGSASPKPAPVMVEDASDEEEEEDDGFGDFADAAATPSIDMFGMGPSDEAPASPTKAGDNGFLGGPTSPQPAVVPTEPFMDPMAAVATPPRMSVTEAGRSLSIDDAFGDMPVPQDAPLPSLEDMMMTTNTAASAPAAASENEDDEDGDDFGAFEAAAEATLPGSNVLPTDEAAAVDGTNESVNVANTAFGGTAFTDAPPTPSSVPDGMGFGAAQPPPPSVASIGRSMSIEDAFGDLSAPENAPLPSLEMMGTVGSHPSSPIRQPHGTTGVDDDDDFGGFAGASPGKNDDDDDFGGFSGANPSTEGGGISLVKDDASDDDDEFGDFGAAPSASQEEPSHPTDILGFGAAETVNEPNNILGEPSFSAEALPTMATGVQPLSMSDPFGDMPSNDAPLPSLDMLSAPTNPIGESNALDAANDEDDDDFGDFASPTEAPTANIETTNESSDPISMASSIPASTDPSSISDAFGDFGVADAPLPSLDEAAPPATQEVDLFGDFAGNDDGPANNPVPTGAGDLLDIFGTAPPATSKSFDSHETGDDFGNFGSAEPAPTKIEDDDDFGDFGSAEISGVSSQPPQEDLFGDFSGTETPAPTESKIQTVPSAEEDDFGDFGSAEIATPAENTAPLDDDDFGDFGSAEISTPVDAVQAPEEDDFGNFGSANISAPAKDNVQAALSEDDDFGDFGSAEISSPIETAQTTDDNDFGDFGNAENPTPVKESDHAAPLVDDDFGDFGSAEISTPVQEAAAVQTPEEDDFGDFGSAQISAPAGQPAERDIAKSGDVDFFGAFENAESTAPVRESVGKSQAEETEGFGDFGSAEIVAPEAPIAANGSTEKEDDFGDFGSAEFSPPAQPQNDDDQDEFGDFTVVEPPPATDPEEDFGDFAAFQESSPPTEPPQQASESSDDWGDFETVNPSPKEISEEVRIRDRIRSLALQLPDSVLRKSGVSGDHVDLGELFEVNVGIKSKLTEAGRRRSQRCLQVLESLTSTEYAKLASAFWIQIFDAVVEELEQAEGLLAEAQSFSPAQWKEIRAPLSVLARGLAEYMRVTRSIVASIGDVLLLDETAMLTVDTWASTWCSLSVLEKALACETKWKDIQHRMKQTPLGVVSMVSVQEIRSETGSSSNNHNKNGLCHLTLQPLRDQNQSTTQAQVVFQGKCFMACSANFLAHRCPSFVIGEEI